MNALMSMAEAADGAAATQDLGWSDFGPYVAGAVALIVFAATRYSESRKRNSDVLEAFAATAQEVAHGIAEFWRTAPDDKPFNIDSEGWKRVAGSVDARLTPVLRKVEIIGSAESVAAAREVRAAINAIRDAIEWGVELPNQPRKYGLPPRDAVLHEKWFVSAQAKSCYVEGLPLAWERPAHRTRNSGRRSICGLVSESRTAANGSGSGWIVVWGRWQDSRDRFSQRAREQVGPYWTFDRVVIGSSLLVLAGGVALTLA